MAVMGQAQSTGLTSNEHFSVDGSLIEAWASLKSFRPKDEDEDEKDDKREPPDDKGNPTVNFHGQKRGNTTHASKTDPEARLARKGNGKEARLAYCYCARYLMVPRRSTDRLVDGHFQQARGTTGVHHERARPGVTADDGHALRRFPLGNRRLQPEPEHEAAQGCP
ncbi:hypothetical protein [Myxococcus dinghuensis]|uniref:hypothetical protein n=1 Tax=Myxococcus dinghuensis TaxID=2906761 RepID=UPI003898FEB2